MKLKQTLFALAIATLTFVGQPIKAQAQLSAGGGIAGDSNGNIVGVIYVPEKSDVKNYVEHWILYPDYVYPGQENLKATLTVTPVDGMKYDSLSEFLQENFCKDCRYIEVISNEFHGLEEVKELMK